MTSREARAERWLAAGAVAGLCVVVAAWATAIPEQWFRHDDFAFLARVQHSHFWEWYDQREQRFWNFYRPLGMETYYAVSHGLFGLWFPGFSAVSLLLTLLTAPLLCGIALQLGFGRGVAALTAVFAVTRSPVVHVVFDNFSFQYTSALFFTSAAMAAFLTYLARAQRRYQLVSLVALGLGTLCNEVALVLPGVLALLSLLVEERASPPRALRRALGRIVPHALWVTLYLVFRFGVLPPPEVPRVYHYALGPGLLRNPGLLLSMACESAPGLVLSVASGAGAVLLGCATAAGRRRAWTWLLPLQLFCLAWLLLVMLPFAPLPFVVRRYAAPAALPVAFMVGAACDLFWRSWSPRRPAGAALLLVALLLASLPYATLERRAAEGRGALPRRVYQALLPHAVAGRETSILLLHGGDELAGPEAMALFQQETYGGGVFSSATFPDGRLHLIPVDVAAPRPRRFQPPCVLLALNADLTITAPPRASLDALPPDLLARCAQPRANSERAGAPELPPRTPWRLRG